MRCNFKDNLYYEKKICSTTISLQYQKEEEASRLHISFEDVYFNELQSHLGIQFQIID